MSAIAFRTVVSQLSAIVSHCASPPKQVPALANTRENFQPTIEDARLTMRNKHRLKGNDEDDFGLVNVEEINNQIDQFTGTIAAVVVPITLITLLVGGIVVMNIMLVSVTERTSRGVTSLITFLASITMTITMGYIHLALIVSSVIGMIAGIYPAFKAARLDPIIALTKTS